MKQITIHGKNNIHKCLKANLDENSEEHMVREGMEDLNEDTVTHKIQFDMIRQLYIGGSAHPLHLPSRPQAELQGSATSELVSTISTGITTKIAGGRAPFASGIDIRGCGGRAHLERELIKKIAGYKGQDIKKEIYDKDNLITLEEVIEKLLSTKLKCFYCACNVLVIYKNVREPTQWTLDRKNNDLGHSCDNTLIACLKCNLQRRVTSMEKFDFTKKLRLKKIV